MVSDDPVRSAASAAFDDRFPGLEALSTEPANAEMADRPGARLVTPREHHYVRNHYPTPDIDPSDHTVSLTGTVDGAELSPTDLREEFPTVSLAHTMECSGNGRAYFSPDAEGHQWTVGAVGTAVWTGAPVGAILDAHGAPADQSLWVAAVGADAPADEDAYCRSIPMGKIREDCLLAYEMNGLPLTPEHGAPVRLLVPGWFGNNSVKWIDRLHVMDSMVTGEALPAGHAHYQQESYRVLPEGDDDPDYRDAVDTLDTHAQLDADGTDEAYFFDQLPKSLVSTPEDGATVSPGPVDVVGVAWGGEDPIDRVELSIDRLESRAAESRDPDGDRTPSTAGASWTDVSLSEPALGRYAWRRFRFRWDAAPGDYVVASRATDGGGRTQPARVGSPEEGSQRADETYPWNRKGYGNNAYRSYATRITVRERDG